MGRWPFARFSCWFGGSQNRPRSDSQTRRRVHGCAPPTCSV